MAVAVRRRSSTDFVMADCLLADVGGDVVRVTGDAVNGVYQVSKLDLTTTPTEVVFGLIVSKVNDTRCVVQVGGFVSGLYSGLTPGKILFVGDNSRLTHTVPSRPGSGVKSIHHAAMAIAADVLLLNVQSPSRLIA